MSPDLYDIMIEWGKGKSHFIVWEWNGPGSYEMETVCKSCGKTLGVVNSDRYMAYKYLPPVETPNLTVAEFTPADPKFFDNIIESMVHPCRKR